MVATERRISTAQLFTVVFILGMSLKMLMLPVLMLKAVGRDSVLGMAVVLGSEFICLAAMIAAVVLSPQKSFTELLEQCVGKIAAKIVFCLLALFFFCKLLLLSGEVRIFFSENLFGESPWSLYSLPFFGICVVMGMGSLRTLGRSVQFLFPFIVGATVVMFALIGTGVEFSEVLPIGEFGWRNVSRAAYRHAMWYGDHSVLIVCLGAVKRTKKTAAITAVAGVLSACVVLFFMFGLTATFSNVCYLIRYGQNVTGMSHYALGNVMQGRFDLMLFCVWMFSVFLKAGFFMYAVVFFVRAVVPVNNAWPSLITGALLYGITLMITSATGLHTFMIRYAAAPALAFQFAVPAVMLLVALAGRRKQKRKENAQPHVAAKDQSSPPKSETQGANHETE